MSPLPPVTAAAATVEAAEGRLAWNPEEETTLGVSL